MLALAGGGGPRRHQEIGVAQYDQAEFCGNRRFGCSHGEFLTKERATELDELLVATRWEEIERTN